MMGMDHIIIAEYPYVYMDGIRLKKGLGSVMKVLPFWLQSASTAMKAMRIRIAGLASYNP